MPEDFIVRQMQVIDCDGYRPNVGIILSNRGGQLFWAKRAGQDAWQFPQGGIHRDEKPLDAMYRELQEETGLLPEHVEVLGRSRRWLRYRLPSHLVRKRNQPVCIGQKQIWFILRFTADEDSLKLDVMPRPEFDDWRWVDYWQPVDEVVFFKRRVYREALKEFAPLLFPDGPPPYPLRTPLQATTLRA